MDIHVIICCEIELLFSQNIFWLVGWFGLKGLLRQYMYFSLYRAVSLREGKKRE